MKTAVGVTILLACAAPCLSAQPPIESGMPQVVQVAPAASNLNDILTQVQQATSSASVNIGRLKIDKWKTDAEQKQQMQQIAQSLQKNIANAVPGLINDVQTSKGGVLASFKLYHNLNVVYENLSYLADVAGSLGKKEEFEPLAADAALLEAARSNLSIYIEQTAGKMETALRESASTQARQAAAVPGKKVVVINEDDPPAQTKTAKPASKATKKKTSASPSPTPAQAVGSPH